MILTSFLAAAVFLASPPSARKPADPLAPIVTATFDDMPKVVSLPDGRLMAFFHDLTGEMKEATARTSSDGGKTWSSLRTLFKLPEEAGGFGYSLAFIDRAGELHLFFFCDANSGVIKPNPKARPMRAGLGQLDIWQARTTGGRSRWEPPARIWQGRAGDMQSVTQLKSGRILLPISYWVDRNWGHRGEGADAFTFYGSFRSSAIYSDDGGATWKQSRSELKVPTSGLGDLGAIEPVVIELKDGRVLNLIRTQMGRFYESYSRDGGETWSPAVPSNIHSSDSPAGLLRLKDGRLLNFVNDCRRFPYANGGRQVLHATVSADEGRTWTGWREVIRDPLRGDPPPPNGDHGASYTYPILLPDGRVLFTMWVFTGKTRSIYTFDPKWLDETTASDDFSQGLDGWSVFGTKGAELAANPAKPGSSVLSMRRASMDWPAGAAVWNFPAGASGRVKLRLLLKPGFKGGRIALTDHFSVPFDTEDVFHNLVNLPISPDRKLGSAALEMDRWHDVELDWNTAKRTCRLLVDGKPAGTSTLTRDADYVNYLRLASTAKDADDSGFLIESVQAAVQPQRPDSHTEGER